MKAALAAIRAGEWWDHKLVPALAAFYGTCLFTHGSVWSHAPAALGLLLAIAAAAVFVSIINDLADRRADADAGKPNRMAGRPARETVMLLCLPIAAGLGFLAAWRDDIPLMLAYAGSWLAFSLYSLPPLRLKERGLAGLLADAAGAHVFPALLAILLASGAGRAPGFPWFASVAIWAFAYGIRGILWHQILDSENDRRSNVATFVRRISPARAARLGAFIVFPVEVAALATMLLLLRSSLPLAALIAYFTLLALRARFLGIRPVVVASSGSWAMVLQEYYELYLPVSILCASALVYPMDWLVLLAHGALFPRRARGAAAQVAALVRSRRLYLPGTG